MMLKRHRGSRCSNVQSDGAYEVHLKLSAKAWADVTASAALLNCSPAGIIEFAVTLVARDIQANPEMFKTIALRPEDLIDRRDEKEKP